MCTFQKYFLKDNTEESHTHPPATQSTAPNLVRHSMIINVLWAYDEPKREKKSKIKVNSGSRKGGTLLIFS